jgi:hypothetical protein
MNMNGNYRSHIINSKQRNALFFPIPNEGISYKQLVCDPMTMELARYMSKQVWCRYPR